MVQRGELKPFGGSHREIAKKTVSTIILSNMLMFCIIRMGVSCLCRRINKLNSHLEKKAHREKSNTD